jgi:hypothetical protein
LVHSWYVTPPVPQGVFAEQLPLPPLLLPLPLPLPLLLPLLLPLPPLLLLLPVAQACAAEAWAPLQSRHEWQSNVFAPTW